MDRIYPALSKHEIGASEDRELVVRWQSEIEGAAKELDCRNSTASSFMEERSVAVAAAISLVVLTQNAFAALTYPLFRDAWNYSKTGHVAFRGSGSRNLSPFDHESIMNICYVTNPNDPHCENFDLTGQHVTFNTPPPRIPSASTRDSVRGCINSLRPLTATTS